MKKKNYLLKAKKDPFYNSLWLNKFSNHFVKAGKKFIIETIFFRSFIQFKQLKKWKRLPISRTGVFNGKSSLEDSFPGATAIKLEALRTISFLFYLVAFFLAVRNSTVQNTKQEKYLYDTSLKATKIVATRPLHILLRHFVRNKPFFQLVVKRLGSRVISIPTPLSSNRQLLTAVRMAARDIKIFRSGHNLEKRIYTYLMDCMASGRTLWDRERDKKIKTTVASRTNIRFRWR